MRLTEQLSAEHAVFLTELDVLDDLLSQSASTEVLRGAMLTLAAAVEQHRAVEEEHLFPAMVRQFGEGFPPVQAMEADHQEIGRCIEGVAARSQQTPALVQEFIDILRQHIDKEDHVLFPMAEQQIGAAELERLADQRL
jgi:hemerythrin-like domain-containing protein